MTYHRNRLAKYVIGSRAYKVEKYQYKVIGYTKGKEKIYPYIKAQYASCRGSYIPNSLHYISRQKAVIKISKKRRIRKKSEKKR